MQRLKLLAAALLVSGCVDELETGFEPPGEEGAGAGTALAANGDSPAWEGDDSLPPWDGEGPPPWAGEDPGKTPDSIFHPTRALMDYAGGEGLPDLPVKARWDLPAMAKGDTWSGSYTVPGEAAGYYSVMANAYTRGPDGGPWLFDDVLGH